MLASELLLLRAAISPHTLSTCIDAAAISSRAFSSSSTTAALQSPRKVMDTMKEMIDGPIEKAQAAKNMIVNAPHALYERLPPYMQHYLSLMRQPSLLQRTVTINCQAFWESHGRHIALGGGVLLTLSLWRGIHLTAQQFPSLASCLTPWYIIEPTLAALIASGVSLSLVSALRRRYTIDPTQAYKEALRKLNEHKGVREIMGGPVAGSRLRASVVGGGHLTFTRSIVPTLLPPHVHLVFPASGADRRGLVSLQARKGPKGKFELPLLVLDIPMPVAVGGEQRIYLEGGPGLHASDGVLDELRRPFLIAMSGEDEGKPHVEDVMQPEKVVSPSGGYVTGPTTYKFEPVRMVELKTANALGEGGEGQEGGVLGGDVYQEKGGEIHRGGMFAYEEMYFKAKDWLKGGGRQGGGGSDNK